MPLLKVQETVDRPFPSGTITRESLARGSRHRHKIRGSMRMATGRVMTLEELEARKKCLEEKGLP